MNQILLFILCGGITGAIVGVLLDNSAAVGILGFLVGASMVALGIFAFTSGSAGPD